MIPALLHPALVEAAAALDPTVVVEYVVPTGNPEHGDYQWNIAFRMTKALKEKPLVLAEKLVGHIRHPGIVSAEVAGAGFINLRLSDSWLAELLKSQVASPTLGVEQVEPGQTVIIDFSSPNVAKRMHVGHMRSTHLGDALAKMMRAAGWTVIGDNHIGDWGTPFGKLLVAWRLWKDDNAFAEDPIGELERLYVTFGEVADEGMKEAARTETAKLQNGDPENTALWRLFLDVSMKEFEAVYRRMGVSFDVVLGESTYHPLIPATLNRLEGMGAAEVSDGALISQFAKKGRDQKDTLILRKKDGAYTYGATDIACALYREERWHPNRVIYVTDVRQQGHFQQLFELARRLEVKTDLTHIWFGMLVLPEGSVAMSTRSGNTIRLVDLLDEAVRRAREVVEEKSPHLPEEEKARIAEAVGVGAVRYVDLSQNPQTDVTFEWDRILSLEGNTAPYLIYGHARCAGVLRKANAPLDFTKIVIEHPLERELALALLRVPEAFSEAIRLSKPNVLADRLYKLVERLNGFYHHLPVLKDGEVNESRLALVEATRRVLSHGLTALGLVPLKRM